MKKELSFFIALIGKKLKRVLTNGRGRVLNTEVWVCDCEATAAQLCNMQKFGYMFEEIAEPAKDETKDETKDTVKEAAAHIVNGK